MLRLGILFFSVIAVYTCGVHESAFFFGHASLEPWEKLAALLLAVSAPPVHRSAPRERTSLLHHRMADGAVVSSHSRNIAFSSIGPDTFSDLRGSHAIPCVFEFSGPGSSTMDVFLWSSGESTLSRSGLQCFGYIFSGKAQLVKKKCQDCKFIVSQGQEFYLQDAREWMVGDADARGVLLHMHESKELVYEGRKLEDHYLFPVRNPPEDSSALLVGDKMHLSGIGPILEMATFYPGAQQSLHTHPTPRIVVMLSGHGKLEWFDELEDVVKSMPVAQGMAFGWGPNVPHAFSVENDRDAPLEIFAFQTDSDTVNYAWPASSVSE